MKVKLVGNGMNGRLLLDDKEIKGCIGMDIKVNERGNFVVKIEIIPTEIDLDIDAEEEE